ncbi:MAG: flagellar basal body-associated FliL family protein [Calditrichales bacterium]|nr:flagellar basal body-associated FliL family protein [Calditrichales bacterium]
MEDEKAVKDKKEQESSEEVYPGKKKNWGLIIGVVLAQLIAVGFIVKFLVFPSEGESSESVEEEAEQVEETKGIGLIYKISDLTINPKNSMGKRFAVFEVALEVEDAAAVEELKKYNPIIVDRFIGYFRTKTVLELSSQESLVSIKKDLKEIVNDVMQEEVVNNLYFTRYVLE